MDNFKKEIENEAIATMVLGVLLFIFVTLLSAFTTAYLWNNIMAVIFPLPALTLVQAFAVDWFVTYIVVPYNPGGKTFTETASSAISKTLMFLVIGWIVIQFI